MMKKIKKNFRPLRGLLNPFLSHLFLSHLSYHPLDRGKIWCEFDWFYNSFRPETQIENKFLNGIMITWEKLLFLVISSCLHNALNQDVDASRKFLWSFSILLMSFRSNRKVERKKPFCRPSILFTLNCEPLRSPLVIQALVMNGQVDDYRRSLKQMTLVVQRLGICS